MKVKVQNLGNIREGEVDLDKNLIVFTGENNTGKSYMAYLIYGVLKTNKIHEFLLETPHLAFDSYYDESLKGVNFVNLIKNNVSQSLVQYQKDIDKVIKDDLLNIFSSKKVKANVSLEFEDFLPQYIETKSANIFKMNPFLSMPSFGYDIENLNILNKKEINHIKPVYETLVKIFLNRFLKNIVYFFPAERTALGMVSNAEVEKKSLEKDEIATLLLLEENNQDIFQKLNINKFLPKYPQAINDYIYFVNDLRNITKQESEFAYLADEIEARLLKGKVNISEYGEMNFSPENAENQQNLEIHVSSSMVKSLSGLVLYFRHLAQKGDTIMIDEPELNLHPNNQRMVAKILAKVANLGFRVILSTHSDYILKEFNNLIMLHKSTDENTKKQLLETYGYQEEEILDKETMAVYYFHKQGIEDLEIKDTGFHIESIDEEIIDLDKTMEDIYFKLFELEQ